MEFHDVSLCLVSLAAGWVGLSATLHCDDSKKDDLTSSDSTKTECRSRA